MRIAGGARADAVHQRIAADRHRGEQREGDRAAVEMASSPPPRSESRNDAADQQRSDAEPSRAGRLLADEQRAAERGHQRRGAARDRIDLPHVAGAVGLGQRRCSSRDAERPTDQPRPGRERRQADEQATPAARRRRPRPRSAPSRGTARADLEQRVPAAHGRRPRQDAREDEGIHARLSLQLAPAPDRTAAFRLARTGTALARDVDLEARSKPRVVDARAAGRRIAERHDAADACGRKPPT